MNTERVGISLVWVEQPDALLKQGAKETFWAITGAAHFAEHY